jgi:hypothetical protein
LNHAAGLSHQLMPKDRAQFKTAPTVGHDFIPCQPYGAGLFHANCRARFSTVPTNWSAQYQIAPYMLRRHGIILRQQ